LGLDWNREYNNSHYLEEQPVEDNQNYQDLKAFYEAGGDINTVTKRSSLKMSNDGTWELVRDASATATGAWLCDQRRFYRTGRMKESRVQGLEAIGIIWELEKPVPISDVWDHVHRKKVDGKFEQTCKYCGCTWKAKQSLTSRWALYLVDKCEKVPEDVRMQVYESRKGAVAAVNEAGERRGFDFE
jgi:hypothetical protein